MEPHQLLNPGHGPAAPRCEPPKRAPESVRRTTTVDIIRPEGFTPGLLLVGRGRDLWTRADGKAAVLDTASFRTDIEFPGSRRILTINAEPGAAELAGLVGQDALNGFRRRVAELTPGSERTLLLHLLDDVPGATLIAGHSQIAERAEPGVPTLPILAQRNVCAGWSEGSTLMKSIDDGDMIIVSGPPTLDRDPATDPLAWHEVPSARPTMMRRRRLLDVGPRDDGWRIEAYFRDSHWPRSGPIAGRETVIHEYALTADVSADLVLTDARAIPLVLPWNECLAALDSPTRILGSTLSDIDQRVRSDFRGPGTCTHLNDVMRSLAGISTLLGPLLS